ncbi:Pycsar system effector family protein [Streptomyces sp. NPDC004752]
MTSASTAWDSPQVQAGTRLLADIRAEITRADAKAAVLVGVLGLTSGVLTVLPTGRIRRIPTSATALVWWAGATCLIVALLSLLLAVIPRYGRSRWEPGRPLTYFGDIQRAARTSELAEALVDTGRDPTVALLLALTEASRIAARKHLWIRTGLLAYVSAAVLLPGSVLLV